MPKIMVVDDELEICAFLRSFFEERLYEVVTATSGEEALRKIEKERPQVVLLDIKMPGKDGIDVLRELKQKFPKVKVIMVTAVETSDKIEQAIKLGADNYITKPLSLEYLEMDVKDKITKLVD
ncbi:MAG: response regulator [Candidatus Omnitrophica bacterium]|nr:response regulator [Candidatus Omnitrophota bacterium]